ncbi:MAG: methyltransferase [Aquabacterium sp.]
MAEATPGAAGGPPRRHVSPAGHAAPAALADADDTLGADAAYRLLEQGTGLVWRGDFHNARQLLQALGRRFERRHARPGHAPRAGSTPAQVFEHQRRMQASRVALLCRLLVPVEPGWRIALKRAPDLAAACAAALGPLDTPALLPLRELQGLSGAWQWQLRGVPVPALATLLGGDARVHPHHGVFAPVRSEYVDLVARAPLPPAAAVAGALDIGTGTGVLAAVLAARGVADVTATDRDPRALACARDNLARLLPQQVVTVRQADLFNFSDASAAPARPYGLVVCNPPWVPAPAEVGLDAAVYDPDSAMLRGYLAGLAAHLAPGGEGWLILSDLAEHLGLRSRAELRGWIQAAGLAILDRLDIRPTHRRTLDTADPLHRARSAEVTSLWRLGRAG